MIRITLIRKEQGLSQSRLSHLAEMGAPDISRIESGRQKPYPVQMEKLSRALGWSGDPSELFEEVGDDVDA